MSKHAREQRAVIEQMQILSDHCQGIRIAVNTSGAIIGYIPCTTCKESGEWCGEHKIIGAGSAQGAVSRDARIKLFRRSYDRAREGGLIPIPTEETRSVRLNVVPIRKGA